MSEPIFGLKFLLSMLLRPIRCCLNEFPCVYELRVKLFLFILCCLISPLNVDLNRFFISPIFFLIEVIWYFVVSPCRWLVLPNRGFWFFTLTFTRRRTIKRSRFSLDKGSVLEWCFYNSCILPSCLCLLCTWYR